MRIGAHAIHAELGLDGLRIPPLMPPGRKPGARRENSACLAEAFPFG